MIRAVLLVPNRTEKTDEVLPEARYGQYINKVEPSKKYFTNTAGKRTLKEEV